MNRFAIAVAIGISFSFMMAQGQEYEDRPLDLPDSAAVVAPNQPDSLDAASPKKIEKIKVVRRKFKYREQVGVALGMMAFIALILTTVQSWNPE
jgi:hypothetical protein